MLGAAKAHLVSSTNSNLLTDVVVTGSPKDLRLTVGGVQKTISTGGGTLQEVVNAINNANAGVRASTLKLSDGTSRLRVESTTTGAASAFTLTRTNGQPFMGGMATATAGADASIKIGADTIKSATNTFTNLLPGVNLTLGVDAVANTVVTSTLATDSKTMTETLKGLVDALNGVLQPLIHEFDRDRAVGTEANVVRRPRHFRVRLTEDISRDGLSVRSPVKLGSRRRRHVRLRQPQRSKRSRASTLVGGALIPAPVTAAGQSTL